jgi:hypothetical protein
MPSAATRPRPSAIPPAATTGIGAARDNKRLARRLRQVRLRQNAVVEDTDFRTPRGLDRALFHKLAGCD